MRNDLDKLNIPASAKRYTSGTGLKFAGPAGVRLYRKAMNDIANPGKSLAFKNRDAVGPVKSAIKDSAAFIVNKLLT